ncbi:hypothetical protein DICPUDRAFT_154629 [Dictyostelium purpureum]|uniref:Uncharacterized protein n=1 Tax=Dictyostelium purpureum TaxID=5786 RepID=F0ZRU4_DICPU|nr:uncharacterized protein DICPUDRAFT_154629 [Dictyostelium purpureum]EGC33322.1 hypothetical protein DICPUDRAFT_154629 [Dictyostelium purpureum]|eukprot:XP_003290138.1 hypothetical protein DICPUDRAFT_154629 [Dictyostelium purpureum]
MIVDKLKSNQTVSIDNDSIIELIGSCKEHEVFKLLLEKKRDHLESVDLVGKSISMGSVFALDIFLKYYDQLEEEELKNQNGLQDNKKAYNKLQMDKQSYNTCMMKTALLNYDLVVAEYLITNRAPLVPKNIKKLTDWKGLFNLYYKQDLNLFFDFIVKKMNVKIEDIVQVTFSAS